jgi:hypothetical protein
LKKKTLQQEKALWFVDTFEDFPYLKMAYFLVGTNIETKKLLYILIEKIEEDINILSENLVEVNLFISDISLVKMYGMVMEFVLLTHMET